MRPPAATYNAESRTVYLCSLTGGALLSKCGRYRFRLSRDLGPESPVCVFIMLNPSTADHEEDDPTIRRCIGYAKAWGCGELVVVNLFAYRATDPKELLELEADPRGPLDIEGFHNRHIIAQAAMRAYQSKGPLICAWGVNGRLRGQDVRTMARLRALKPMALKLTKDGDPSHPLYLKKTLKPIAYAGRNAAVPAIASARHGGARIGGSP